MTSLLSDRQWAGLGPDRATAVATDSSDLLQDALMVKALNFANIVV